MSSDTWAACRPTWAASSTITASKYIWLKVPRQTVEVVHTIRWMLAKMSCSTQRPSCSAACMHVWQCGSACVAVCVRMAVCVAVCARTLHFAEPENEVLRHIVVVVCNQLRQVISSRRTSQQSVHLGVTVTGICHQKQLTLCASTLSVCIVLRVLWVELVHLGGGAVCANQIRTQPAGQSKHLSESGSKRRLGLTRELDSAALYEACHVLPQKPNPRADSYRRFRPFMGCTSLHRPRTHTHMRRSLRTCTYSVNVLVPVVFECVGASVE